VQVTHPFHPLSGREFDLVVRKKNWTDDRVFFFNDDGQMRSLPAGWTDVDPPDPFVFVAAGRSLFRIDDLIVLAALLDGLHSVLPAKRVKRTTPSV
jgi:Family of unknown function (DUF5372)